MDERDEWTGVLGATRVHERDTWQAYAREVQRTWKVHRTVWGDNPLVHLFCGIAGFRA